MGLFQPTAILVLNTSRVMELNVEFLFHAISANYIRFHSIILYYIPFNYILFYSILV